MWKRKIAQIFEAKGEREFYLLSTIALSPILATWAYLIQLSISRFTADPWVTAGWLINYSEGFVRRGLLGNVFLYANHISGLSPQFLVLFISACIVFFWALLFLAQIATLKSWAITILIVFSPLAFALGFVSDALLRKENLFFLLIAWAGATRACNTRVWLLLVAASPVLILLHEAIFSWMPALLAIVLIRRPDIRLLAWLVAASTAAMTACLIFKGSGAQATAICHLITRFQQPGASSICSGAVAALGKDVAEYLKNRYLAQDFEQIILVIGLYIFPFLIIVTDYVEGLRNKVIIWITFVALVVLTGPLFYVATDAGRWLRAIFISSLTVACTAVRVESRQGRGGLEIDDAHYKRRALIFYLLVLVTVFVGVSNTGGSYFGFQHSLFARLLHLAS